MGFGTAVSAALAPKSPANKTRSGAELAKYLARHGVEVVLDTVDAEGRTIGDVLRSCVASRDADLLVMGAYGHSRVRDFFLGGATKTMIAQPPLPIFLTHWIGPAGGARHTRDQDVK